MWLHNKSIIMIQDKMHKNGQILTINNRKYRIEKNPFAMNNCCNCDANHTCDCLPTIPGNWLYCTKTIPMTSILKRIDNVKSK